MASLRYARVDVDVECSINSVFRVHAFIRRLGRSNLVGCLLANNVSGCTSLERLICRDVVGALTYFKNDQCVWECGFALFRGFLDEKRYLRAVHLGNQDQAGDIVNVGLRVRAFNSVYRATSRVSMYGSACFLAFRFYSNLAIMRVACPRRRRARRRFNRDVKILSKYIRSRRPVFNDKYRVRIIMANANAGRGLRILNDIGGFAIRLVTASGRHLRIYCNERRLKFLHVFLRRRRFRANDDDRFLGAIRNGDNGEFFYDGRCFDRVFVYCFRGEHARTEIHLPRDFSSWY